MDITKGMKGSGWEGNIDDVQGSLGSVSIFLSQAPLEAGFSLKTAQQVMASLSDLEGNMLAPSPQ